MKWLRRNKATTGFISALAALLIISIASYQSITRLADAEHWRTHSFQVLLELENMASNMKDVVLATRGYVITKNDTYLEPLSNAKPALLNNLSMLRSLLSDNTEQKNKLGLLGALVHRRIEVTHAVIEFKQDELEDSVRLYFSTNMGKRITDSISTILNDIKLQELALLEKRNSSLQFNTTVTLTIILLGGLSMFFFVGRSMIQVNEENTQRTLAESRLRDALTDISDLYNNAPCGYHSLDDKGIIIQINDTELQWLGYTREEVIHKKSIYDLITENSKIVVQKNFENFKKSGALFNLELEFLKKNGGTIPLLINATALLDNDGKFVKSRSTLFDLTARKHAEEKFNSFFSYSLDMLCIAGFDGYFKLLNPSWETTLGYTMEELISRPYMEYVHPDDIESTRKAANQLSEGQDVTSFENRYLCKNGEYKWILWNCTMSVRDQVIYASARDITELKNYAGSLSLLNHKLESTNKELEAFSYSVSHDLRAPLRHIAGYVELVQKHTTAIDEKGKHFLQVISESAKTMGLLIDDLLDFSRLGRVEMRLSPIELHPIAIEVMKTFDTETRERNIQWNVEPLPIVQGDYSLLRVVLVNIFSNAVKYTRKQVSPVITISSTTISDNEVAICVSDNGAGFDMKYSDKLFGVFQRLHSATEFEGTGIGLATVRRVIHRHGGRTWATGEVGKGASVVFTLPRGDDALTKI